MTDKKTLILILTLGLTLALISTVESGGLELDLFGSGSGFGSGCRGSVGECLGVEEDELDINSEIHRRILATGGYISYGALNKNRVPCSRRGASYYNCQPGAQANPYSRGCSNISRCKRS